MPQQQHATQQLVPLLLSSLGLTAIFGLLLIYSPNPFESVPKHLFGNPRKEQDSYYCDLFKGHWIRDLNVTQYTNSSCATIPDSKNCFMHGRPDKEFLNWRWKPDECDLPRFDPNAFLEIVRGKTLAFIGDSVARNQIESLLCLLSQDEVPVDLYKDKKDRNRIWNFPSHNFTLKVLWTKFLVVGQERGVDGKPSGVFDLHLDKLDNWTSELHTVDYVIISDAQWFFRPMYLHRGSNVVACVYCNETNVPERSVNFAVRMAFRAALSWINDCKMCKSMLTLLRTYSPSHFENGLWSTGGTCNRTSPLGEGEIDLGANDWALRGVQVEEIERVRKRRRQGKKFEVLDVTGAMLMRPDGHPGDYWRSRQKKGFNDCVHWCLPGPIDAWNDFLLAILTRLVG